jgi:hypothetical protein
VADGSTRGEPAGRKPSESFGGVVENFIGDAVVTAFGPERLGASR